VLAAALRLGRLSDGRHIRPGPVLGSALRWDRLNGGSPVRGAALRMGGLSDGRHNRPRSMLGATFAESR
jgi:hypothetical protein